MNQKLVLTRGIPGSGKTTRAEAWVKECPEGETRARVNRDDLRRSVFSDQGVLDYSCEQAITAMQQAIVTALLANGASVVVDDMNLRAKYSREWADLARACGVEVEVWDFIDVPLETCIARDAARGLAGGRSVGEQVIRDIYARFLTSGRLAPVAASDAPARMPVKLYVPDGSLPPAWIVDIDGTLALMTSGRKPYDWSRVGEDALNAPVAEMVAALASHGTDSYDGTIIVMSGRDESCRDATEEWLIRHGIPWDSLLMRPAGDSRKDAVVKAELFDKFVAPRYNVRGVIDDRDQVVAMWRAKGLMCAQVAYGAF